jgi:hypothetical protein
MLPIPLSFLILEGLNGVRDTYLFVGSLHLQPFHERDRLLSIAVSFFSSARSLSYLLPQCLRINLSPEVRRRRNQCFSMRRRTSSPRVAMLPFLAASMAPKILEAQ